MVLYSHQTGAQTRGSLGLVEFEDGAIFSSIRISQSRRLGLVEFEDGAIFHANQQYSTNQAGACRV